MFNHSKRPGLIVGLFVAITLHYYYFNMKYFFMRGAIDAELMNRFIDFYNLGYDQVSIILNTEGGTGIYGQVIIQMINSIPDCTLIMQKCYSTGFYIAQQAKCKKLIGFECKGMFHYGYHAIDLSMNGKPDTTLVKIIMEETKRIGPIRKAMAEIFMKAEELQEFEKGYEVYFGYERMKEIFPNAQIL